jgi:hypothetical protein
MVNCGDVNLTPAPPGNFASNTQFEICTEPPMTIGLYTNVLFVVDKSGSNVQQPGATDPNKSFRANAIRNFFESHRDNAYIKWGFIKFRDSEARSYIPDQGGTNRIFTSDGALMEAALEQFMSENDDGATPYQAALNLTTNAIREEIEASEEIVPNFNVIFISDGGPTDYGYPGPTDNERIFTDVENLVDLSSGNIHMSTVYYGPNNDENASRLEEMANRGGGIFQNANTDPDLNIDDLIIGRESGEPYEIKYFGVYNLTSAACLDGSVDSDSDMDGLCDKDEVNLNQDAQLRPRMNGRQFSATNRNSFDPKFSDAIYYRYLRFNESLPSNCIDEGDDDFDLLNNCEEKFLTNSSPQGPTQAWTEEMILNGKQADRYNFDSDGDGILDFVEFVWFSNKSAAVNFLNMAQRTNGIQNSELAENHLNPKNPSSSLPYEPLFSLVRVNSFGQNCYSYSQKNLPLYQTQSVTAFQAGGYLNLAHQQNENVVLVYFIQTPEYAPNTKGFLRFSYQKLRVNEHGPTSLNLDTRNFDIYPR